MSVAQTQQQHEGNEAHNPPPTQTTNNNVLQSHRIENSLPVCRKGLAEGKMQGKACVQKCKGLGEGVDD